jgi:hypothetical protein
MASADETAIDPASATLTIHRTSPDDEGSRQILISIDGTYVGQLLFGQALTRRIAPGAHKLTANNTLVWKSAAFDAEAGSHVQFTVRNRAWGGSLMRLFFVFFGAVPLALSLEPGPPAATPSAPAEAGS